MKFFCNSSKLNENILNNSKTLLQNQSTDLMNFKLKDLYTINGNNNRVNHSQFASFFLAKTFLLHHPRLYNCYYSSFPCNFYSDPLPVSTTNTVLKRILRSIPKHQFFTYFISSFTTSSKSVISLRPLTCHMPVKPGFTASLAR